METQKSPAATGPFRNLSTNFLTSIKPSHRHCSLGIDGGGSSPLSRKKQTKTERAYMLIISTPGGVTEDDIFRVCRSLNGRNYTYKLEKEAQIQLERTRNPNPGGTGIHSRYRIRSAEDAHSALMVVISLMSKRGARPLPEDEVRRLLKPYTL